MPVRLRALAMVVIVLSLAACTTSTVKPPPGVVTGLAQECIASASPVKVSLYSGRTRVASETVPAGSSYKLSAAAGTYQVEGLGGSPESVTVRTGRTVTVNSPILDCQ